MGEPYKMTFLNATDQPWHFAVYKSIPASPGLSSVAWQVRGVPPKQGGNPPPSAQVNWDMNYGLCIADFDKDFNKFTGTQYGSASLGMSYEIKSDDGIPTINPSPTGKTTSDQILLVNSTTPAMPVTMGFTLSGNIVVAEQDVGKGERTTYRVHPQYYVACYRNIVLGQLVDEGVAIGPVLVSYDGGAHSKTVQASKNVAGEYFMEVC